MPIGWLISFDNNPQGVYYAGEELSGTVDFNVDTNKRVKGICLIKKIKVCYSPYSEKNLQIISRKTWIFTIMGSLLYDLL